MAAAVAVAIAVAPGPARAQAGGAPDGEALAPDRLEPAVLPVLAGNTDIGFLFGVYGALARFEPGYDPYRFKVEAITSVSVKAGPDGAELPVHNHGVAFDLPGLAGGRVRLLPEISFVRGIDAGYFGLGNASDGARGSGENRRRYQYVRNELVALVVARIALDGGFNLLAGARARYELVEPYPGSKLAEDAAALGPDGEPLLRGTSEHAAAQLALGLLLDTRDHETTPSRGLYHELSVRGSAGEDLWFIGATLNARFFVPLAGDRLVLATRLMTDTLFGAPPFYELSRAGGFAVMELPGGKSGVRGVPAGRYHGPFKLVANAELRAIFLSFTLARQRFNIGAAAFADAGRVWSRPELDGQGLGLKYGLGGGPRFSWGETVVVRTDVAYSPDAALEEGDAPVGVYVEIGQSF